MIVMTDWIILIIDCIDLPQIAQPDGSVQVLIRWPNASLEATDVPLLLYMIGLSVNVETLVVLAAPRFTSLLRHNQRYTISKNST